MTTLMKLSTPTLTMSHILKLQKEAMPTPVIIKITSIWWSHSLSEIMMAFLNEGFSLTNFKEYNYSPFDCFRHTTCIGKDKYRIKHLEQKNPNGLCDGI